MELAINIIVGLLVMVVLVWVAIFGGVGALLSHVRGGSAIEGLAWGTLLGPIGWGVIVWRTRGRSRTPTDDDWLSGSSGSWLDEDDFGRPTGTGRDVL